MKSSLRLALLTLVAIAFMTGCRSPTDLDPTPPNEEEEEPPSSGGGNQDAFLSFSGAPILV